MRAMTLRNDQRTNSPFAKRALFLRHYLQLFAVIVASFLCLTACSTEQSKEDTAGDFVALINGNALTRKELSQMIPSHLSAKDSTALAKEYIYSWACDQLMFDQAKWDKNVNQEIERKVEQYRKQLIIYEYEKRLINDEFSNPYGLDKITDYLSSLTEKPKASERYAQGVLLIVPNTAEHIAQIRRYAQLKKADDVENLEKYCHQIGVMYRLFNDHWQKTSQIQPIISDGGFAVSELFKTKGAKELKGDGKILFLTLTQLIQPGEELPEGLAEEAVKEEFEKTEQIRYIKEYRKQLYDRSIEKRELILRN